MVQTVTTDDLANRKAAAYLDFVTGLRIYNGKDIRGEVQKTYEAAAASDSPPRTLDDMKDALDPHSTTQWWKRLARTSQEMNWAGSMDAMDGYADSLEATIKDAETKGPGRLILQENFVYPEYFDQTEFHIQPGSYHGTPLSGYVYYYGVQVFHAGTPNDPKKFRPMLINRAPIPKDGKVERIVDLASSIGFTTQAWKRRFPDADVWGTDIAAPMVRYAHKLAIDEGLDITFAQMAAENLNLIEDDSVDLVYVHILFHELPVDVTKKALAEAYRVLRPGGIFACADFGPATDWTPWNAYMRDFDSNHNGEPFAFDFCHMDLVGAMREAGFKDVTDERQPGVIVSERVGHK